MAGNYTKLTLVGDPHPYLYLYIYLYLYAYAYTYNYTYTCINLDLSISQLAYLAYAEDRWILEDDSEPS